MDLIGAISALESRDPLHEGRLLVLLLAFAGDDNKGEIEGLTKIAKLDFLLRYPTFLQRALEKKHKSTKNVGLQQHEQLSVESKMVRYRFGPWDHRYRRFLNLAVAKGLARITVDGRTVKIGLTDTGATVARGLAASDAFADITRRAAILKTHFDMTASGLMRFIYEAFPEILSLRADSAINP